MADRKRTKGRVLLDVHIPGGWFLGVLAGLVLILVIVVAVFSSLNKIATCDVCHVIKPEVVAYKQSAHYKAGVGCQKCHTKPGVFNYFIRNLQGVTNLILYVSNTYQRPITSYVGDESCLQCHPNSQIEKDIVVGNIRINHKGLRQAGYQCLTCHANISHPGTRLAVSRDVAEQDVDLRALPRRRPRCRTRAAPATSTASRPTAPRSRCSLKLHVVPVPRVPPAEGLLHQVPQRPRDAASRRLDQGPRPDRARPRQERLRLLPHRQGPEVLHPTATVCRCRTRPAGGQVTAASGSRTRSVRQVPRPGQLHQVPRPADAASGRLAGRRIRRRRCRRRACAPSATAAPSASAATASSLPHSSSFMTTTHPDAVYSNGGVCVKCHHNNGAGPNGCYGGQCHSGSITPPK